MSRGRRFHPAHVMAALLFCACASAPRKTPEVVPAHALGAAPVASVSSSAAAAPATIPSKAPPPLLDVAPLEAVSVAKRFPDLDAEDSRAWGTLRGEIIDKAIDRAAADMFMTYVANGRKLYGGGNFHLTDSGHFGLYPDPTVSTGVLDKHKATTVLGYSDGATYLLSVTFPEDEEGGTPIADRTPILIWEVTRDERGKTSVEFVTFGGEAVSFEVEPDGPTFETGVPPSTGWPPAITNAAFGRHAFAVGVRTEAVSLDSVDRAFLNCAEHAAIRPKKLLSDQEFAKTISVAVRNACKKQITAWEKAMQGNMDAHVKAGEARVQRAKTRLKVLGISH
jgi:hypothetical protein